MPQTIPAEVVTKHAVVGGRASTAGWFAERGLEMDMLRVAETSQMRDGVKHTDRYVALDDLDDGEAAHYDHIVHV